MSGQGPKTILAVGEVLWDILPDCTRLGGAPFNFTCRINSLNERGIMVSRLGRDALGDEALKVIGRLGVDTALLQRDDVYPTGTVRVSFDERRLPDYLIVPDVAYDHIELTEVLLEAVARADCLCFGTLVQRSETTRQTLRQLLENAAGCLKVLDINLRKDCYSRATVEYSLQHADLLKLNDTEVRMLDELLELSCGGVAASCRAIMDRYPVRHCLVTFGEQGAVVVSRNGEQVYEPGWRVPLADSLGSGDAFTAGFVHKYLHGESVGEACRFGNMLGAIVATQVAGTDPIPAGEIERFGREFVERNVLPEFASGVRPR